MFERGMGETLLVPVIFVLLVSFFSIPTTGLEMVADESVGSGSRVILLSYRLIREYNLSRLFRDFTCYNCALTELIVDVTWLVLHMRGVL